MNFSIYIDPQFRVTNQSIRHNNSPASSPTLSPSTPHPPRGPNLHPQIGVSPASSFNPSPASPQNFQTVTHFLSFGNSPSSASSIAPASPQNPLSIIHSIVGANSPPKTKWEKSPTPAALFAQNTLATTNPADFTTLIARAKNYLSEENWDLAIEALETIPAGANLEKEEMLGIAYEAKGIEETTKKQYSKANEFFKISLYCSPKSTRTWAYRGNVCLNLKSDHESFRCFNQALKLEPDYPPALIGMGMINEASGKLDLAIDCYKKAFDKMPTSKEASQRLTNAYETKALAYKKIGQYDGAISQLKLSLKINEERAFPHLLMGNLYYLKLNDEEALQCYDRALRLAPECPLSLAGKGEVFLKQNKLDQAFPFLEQAHRLDPEERYIKVLLNKALTLMAKKYQDNNQLKEAIDLYTRSILLCPGEIKTLSERALIYYKAGHNTAAENEFEVVLRLNPNHYQSLVQLGAVLIKNKKFAKSIQTLTRALKIRPNDPFALNRIQEAYHCLAATLQHTR